MVVTWIGSLSLRWVSLLFYWFPWERIFLLQHLTSKQCAKYAGPNDEYICTGSDSGHSFIYDKFSGSVVSLLKADMSTCNGIIPHPTLPVFVTYGISSTAKLWRATIPVDDGDDDSVNVSTEEKRNRIYSIAQYSIRNIYLIWFL